MHVFIISVLRFASLFNEQTFFEQTKKQKVSDSPHEACSVTHPGCV